MTPVEIDFIIECGKWLLVVIFAYWIIRFAIKDELKHFTLEVAVRHEEYDKHEPKE
jgi:hypothetical protein